MDSSLSEPSPSILFFAFGKLQLTPGLVAYNIDVR